MLHQSSVISVDTKTFVDFSNALDSHFYSGSNSFFDNHLLELIETYFGFTHTAISIYDNNLKFSYAIGPDNMYNLLEYYMKYFYKIDPFSKFIREQCDFMSPSRPLLYKSTDVSKNYYNNYLSTANLGCGVSMPFKNYRVNIFKSHALGDFTEEELEVIEYISSMLRNRYNCYTDYSSAILSCKAKNYQLDAKGIGHFTLDENNNIIDYNESAAMFFSKIMKTNNIVFAVNELIGRMNSDQKDNKACSYITYENYKIGTRIHYFSDNANFLHSITSVTITDMFDGNTCFTHANELNSEHVNHFLFERYKLTARETEILLKFIDGMTNKSISEELLISLHTVRTHIKNIYRKFGVDNQRALINKCNHIHL